MEKINYKMEQDTTYPWNYEKLDEATIIQMAKLNYDAENEILFRKEKNLMWDELTNEYRNNIIAVMRRFLYKCMEFFGWLD